MPIIELQRRLREIGRIRIGEQVEGTRERNGKTEKYTRPSKLAAFRFTSRDRKVIDAAAEAFGGDAAAWQSPDGDQWEVKSTTAEIACVVPPGDMAFSQWYELWSAGGCKRRCDGITEHITETPCKCDPEARECAIHTRISLLLTDLPGLGLWRLDTSGYYAAVELGGVVDLASSFTDRGQMLPARLRLEQRSTKREIDGKVQTRRYAVPILDLDVHPLALVRAGTDAPALGVGDGPSFTPVPVGELPPAPVGTIAQQLAQVDQPKQTTPRRNAAAPLPSTGLPPRTAAQAASGDRAGNGERLCTRCSQPLGNAVVERDGAGYAHKGDCPGPFGEPDPASGSDITVKQLAAAATKAFPLEDAPRGTKTARRDLLRYALTYVETNGTEWHMDRLNLEQKVKLDARLHDIIEGRMSFRYDDTGATFILGDNEVTVAWSDVEDPPEQQSLGENTA